MSCPAHAVNAGCSALTRNGRCAGPAVADGAVYRLLVVATSADRSELALFSGLRKAGVAVELLIDPDSPRRKVIETCFPETGFLKIRHRLDFRAAAQLRHRIKSRPPDLLYAPSNRPLSIALMATWRLPVCVVGYRGTVGHLSRWDPAAWLTYLHPRLAHIVCVSDAVEHYLRDRIGIPQARLTRIYKGHDPAWYDNPPQQTLTRAAFGMPEDALVAGFVGRMRPVKGVDVLIRALDDLPGNLHLLLVGEVDDPRLQPLAAGVDARAKRTHFTGHSTHIVEMLGLCDLFVMPSVAREGLPRAAIEAMCRRIPVVVSQAGGLPELVDHGRCGLVVPPRDSRALAAAMVQLAGDAGLRHRLGHAGRMRIETHFHIDETLRRTFALHRALLTRSRRS